MEILLIIVSIIAALAIIISCLLWQRLSGQRTSARNALAAQQHDNQKLIYRTHLENLELSLLLNAFDDALIITNSDGFIQVVNQSTRKIAKGETLKGNKLEAVFRNNEISSNLRQLITKGEAEKRKVVLKNSKFGSDKVLDISAWLIDYAPLEIEESNESDSVSEDPLHRVIIRNVTKEHRTDQIKREFVANASHELRTPLAIISGYLENLIDDDMLESPETARPMLTTMRKHSVRLAQLIEEMLVISKLESGDSARLNLGPFFITETINTVIDRVNPLVQKQQAKINTDFQPDILEIIGDSFYWEQVVFNIIENALKQNHDSPIEIDVDLSIDQENNTFTLKITDNGKGIPSSHLPYIFNRFYRVQKHHSQNQIKGTGLGLSIVKHSIESHGGSISATSTPGIETTFTIVSPINTKAKAL